MLKRLALRIGLRMAISNYTQDDVLQSFRQLCAAQSTEEVHNELTILAVVNIFLSIFAILGNTVILVALNKVSFLHSQSRLLFRSLATTDLCVGIIVEPLFVGFLISIVKENWIVCFYMAQVSGVTGYALCATSLLILTAISVDRLLALLPEIRYRQVVTTRRVRLMVTLSWVVTIFFSTMYSWNYRISLWYVQTLIILCSFISLISYTKIFLRLRHHQVQTQDHINPAHSFPTRMARFRKTVISDQWSSTTCNSEGFGGLIWTIILPSNCKFIFRHIGLSELGNEPNYLLLENHRSQKGSEKYVKANSCPLNGFCKLSCNCNLQHWLGNKHHIERECLDYMRCLSFVSSLVS